MLFTSATTHRRLVALTAGIAGIAVMAGLASCSSSGTEALDTKAPGAQSPGKAPGKLEASSTAAGAPLGKVRLVNIFASSTGSGMSLDVYDTAQPGPDDKPLISGLAYGAVSPYVSPGSRGSNMSHLFVVAAGTRPSASELAHPIGTTGYTEADQVTEVLAATPSQAPVVSQNPLDQMSVQDIYETTKETTHGPGGTIPATTPGKALILANGSAFQNVKAANGETASPLLMIKGACRAADNAPSGGSSLPLVSGGLDAFPVDPGVHEVGATILGSQLPADCSGLTSSGKITVTAAAGKTIELFVYGTKQADVHLLAAPVDS